MAAEKFSTSIIVRESRVTSSGRTKAGGTYTLYQVIATKPDGSAISQNLRCFEDLPTNEVIEVECELYRSERYGDSYTVSRKGSRGGGGSGGGSGGLGKSLDDLRARVERIEQFLAGRGEWAGQAAPAAAQASAPPAPPPPPPIQPDPEHSDIPF